MQKGAIKQLKILSSLLFHRKRYQEGFIVQDAFS